MKYIAVFFITLLASSVAYFSIALALTPAPIEAEYWVREMIVIKRNIVKQFSGKEKVIVVSGSNALFGIDAKQLSDELHTPVINFGLHAGLPLSVILSEAESNSEKGDVVILPLESSYYCIKEPTSWQVRNIIAWDREQWENRTIFNRIKALRMFNATFILELAQAEVREKLFPWSIRERLIALDDEAILHKATVKFVPDKFAYSAYNLDALGDMTMTSNSTFSGIARRADLKINVCQTSLEALNTFAGRMKRKGVTIYFANTPYVKLNDLDMQKVKSSSEQLTIKLSEIAPMLDDKSQMIFPIELFFNSDLHLNAEGRKLRTKMLADDMRSNESLLAIINQE